MRLVLQACQKLKDEFIYSTKEDARRNTQSMTTIINQIEEQIEND